MKRTQDDFRALLDLIDVKLRDQDTFLAKVRLSLSNSFAYQCKKLTGMISGADFEELLFNCANDAISERRRKLDHEVCLLLQQRYQLQPGNLREKFDDCWVECLSQSTSQSLQKTISSLESPRTQKATILLIIPSQLVHDADLVGVTSMAWKNYLLGIRQIVAKEWKEAFCD